MLSRLTHIITSPKGNSFLDVVLSNDRAQVEKILNANPDAILEVNNKNQNALWIAATQNYKNLADALILFGEEYVSKKLSENDFQKAARYYLSLACYYYHKKNYALQSSLLCDQAIACLKKLSFEQISVNVERMLSEAHYLKYLICSNKTEEYRIKQDLYAASSEAKSATMHIQDAIEFLESIEKKHALGTQDKITLDEYKRFLLSAYNAHALICKELGEQYVEEKRWTAALSCGYNPSTIIYEQALKHIQTHLNTEDSMKVDTDKIYLNIAVNEYLAAEAYHEMSRYQSNRDEHDSAFILCKKSIAHHDTCQKYLNLVGKESRNESWNQCNLNYQKSLSRSHGTLAQLYRQRHSPNLQAAITHFENALCLLDKTPNKNVMPKDELDKEMYLNGLKDCKEKITTSNGRSLSENISNPHKLFNQRSKSTTALEFLIELNSTKNTINKTP